MAQKKVKNPCLQLYNSCTITQHFHSCVISSFERGVNEICALLGFSERRLAVSCRHFETTVGGGEILTAVLVKIQAIWAV
jgi:hypothetical protein